MVYALSLSPCSSSVHSAINTVIRRPFLIESATVGILKGNGEGRKGREAEPGTSSVRLGQPLYGLVATAE